MRKTVEKLAFIYQMQVCQNEVLASIGLMCDGSSTDDDNPVDCGSCYTAITEESFEMIRDIAFQCAEIDSETASVKVLNQFDNDFEELVMMEGVFSTIKEAKDYIAERLDVFCEKYNIE